MSALFRKPKAVAVPVAPEPRDDAAREAAELARRAANTRGKATTVLTRLMRSARGPESAPKTTLGGG